MTGVPAFQPAFEALKSLGPGPHHFTEIARVAGRRGESISNSFNYHLTVCREKGYTPAIVRVQNGMWALNETHRPAPAKQREYAPPVSKPTNALFEHFHTTKNGTMLVRGTDETVYTLKELDI